MKYKKVKTAVSKCFSIKRKNKEIGSSYFKYDWQKKSYVDFYYKQAVK